MKNSLQRLLGLAILLISFSWSTDAQILINDFYTGASSSTIGYSGKIGDKLFFTVQNPTSELWVSDRSSGSLNMIGPTLPGVDAAVTFNSKFLIFRDSLLVFTSSVYNDMNFYSTNGSLAGTQYFKTLSKGNLVVQDLVSYSNKFYFQGYDIAHGTELWESDGTEAGTKFFADLLPGQNGSTPTKFKKYNDKLWFSNSASELWYLDDLGVHKVAQYYPGGPISLDLFTSSDSEPAYFMQTYSTPNLKRIVKVNPDATTEILDTTISKYSQIIAYKNHHLFYYEINTESSPYTRKIIALNASTGDTSILITSLTTNINYGYTGWTDEEDNVFFALYNENLLYELWTSDGSHEGTQKIDLQTGNSRGAIYFIEDPETGSYLGASGNIFLRIRIDESDVHLWISDGTSEGTKRIEVEGHPLTPTVGYPFLQYANGYIFIASHPLYGTELWYSDGTNAGTKLLADLKPGTQSPSVLPFVIHNDTLFMKANLSADYGAELYAFPINLCEGVDCPEGFECVYGECMPIDYCADVLCPEGQVCYEGGCFEGCLADDCLELGPNLYAGHNATIQLDAGPGYDFYEWSTGEIEQKININTSGRYWVTAYNLAGAYFASDTINLIFKCNPEGNCPVGFECVDGFCIAIDQCSDVPCPIGTSCYQGQCLPTCDMSTDTTGFCYFGLNFNPAPCASVTCGEGDICYEGGCFPTDLCGGNCLDNELCVEGECFPIGDPCADVDCPTGDVCYEGGCFEGCLTGNCIDFGPNLAAGHSTTIVLDAGSGFDIYEWSTGDTTQTVLVDRSGRYWVIAYNLTDSTYSSDTISVIFECNPLGECPEGFNCVDGYCINTDLCLETICPSGEVCFEGGCFPDCLENSSADVCLFGQEFMYAPCEGVLCPEGDICWEGGCFPVDACLEVDCPEGEICYEGGCFPSLLCDDVNCSEGDSCYLGSCFSIIPDAGGSIAMQGNIAEEGTDGDSKKSVFARMPRENISIVLFNETMTGFYATATSDSQGNFNFSNLAARKYKVFVDSDPYEIRGIDMIRLTDEILQNNLQITLVDGAWEIVLNGSTGIEYKHDVSFGLSIYPNPAQNSLYTTSTADLGNVELYIYSSLGGMVHANKLDIRAGEKVLLHEFRSGQQGIYFVQIMKEGEILYSGRALVMGE